MKTQSSRRSRDPNTHRPACSSSFSQVLTSHCPKSSSPPRRNVPTPPQSSFSSLSIFHLPDTKSQNSSLNPALVVHTSFPSTSLPPSLNVCKYPWLHHLAHRSQSLPGGVRPNPNRQPPLPPFSTSLQATSPPRCAESLDSLL